MTDSNATELHELCELLEAQGIEWTKGDDAYQIEWTNPNGQHCSAMYWKPTLTVLMSGCTPEQAVAATLGRGECEDVSTVHGMFICSECGCKVEEEGVDNGGINFCPDCGKAVS